MDRRPAEGRSVRGRTACAVAARGLALAALAATASTSVASARAEPSFFWPSPENGPIYREKAFGKDEGVPSDSIRALAFDSDGYLWIGSQGGLARFDGARFESRRSVETPGLEADRVRSLLTDEDGTLWIGLDRGPLVAKRGDRFAAAAAEDVLCSVEHGIQASDGTLWFAGSHVARWRDGRLEQIGASPETFNVEYQRIAEARDGTIWVVGRNGVARVDGDDLRTVDSRSAHGLFEDLDGALWVSLAGGVAYRLEDAQSREFDVPFVTVYDVSTTTADRKLLATDSGLFSMTAPHAAGDVPEFTSVESDPSGVRAILEGTNGSLWLGCDRAGLRYLSKQKYSTVPLPGLDPGEAVLEVEPLDPRTALVGTPKWRRTWIVTSDLEATPLTSDVDGLDRVREVTTYRDGVAWAATQAGLARLAGADLEPVPGFELAASAVVRADDESIWVEQDSRLVEVLPDGSPGRSTPQLAEPLTQTLAAPGGFLVISDEEVVRVDTSSATTEAVFRSAGAPPRGLALDRRGDLWVSTYGNGLARVRSGGAVDRWTVRNGLPDDFLGWIGFTTGADGGERVWMNTNRGMGSVEFDALDRVDADDPDGVFSRMVECGESNGAGGALLHGGLVLVPTLEGLVAIETFEVDTTPEAPRVAVEWVEIDGERDAADARPRGKTDLAFGYTAILLPRSPNTRFQYRLNGYDEEWVYAGRERTARYANVPPGDYTFEVRARVPGGPWSAIVTSPLVTVTPRWFQRLWVQLGAALAGLATIVLAVGRRTRALMRRGDVLAREVERRRRVEDELRSSEANYLSVLDSAQDGIVMIEADGTIGLANAAMSRIFGYTRDEITGRSATWLGLPDLAATTRDYVDEDSGLIAMRELQASWKTQQLVISRRDGSPVDVELSVAQESFRGRPRLVAIVRDVTERRRMTDRLRDSERRFRQLFRTAPTAILAWRPDLRIVDWNERASALFGWSGHADESIDALFGPDGASGELRDALDTVLHRCQDVTLVHPTRTKDGSERRCRWTFAPLTNANGEVQTVISLVTDVTEDERVARDLESLRRKLARAEETERSRIARELHDDLSQRLAALAIEMQLLENGIEQRSITDVRSAIHAVQRGLDDVSTDVHALSRQLHPTVLDDLGLSRALRSECARRERASDVQVRFVDESGSHDVRDEIGLALFRIAQESVQNAIKHSGAKEVVVRLRATEGAIALSISDDGCGFDADEAASESGGGLGLASVRERARLIGAELDVATEPGEGTTIFVRATPRGEQRPLQFARSRSV